MTPTKPCPACRTPLPGEAQYCTNCGVATPTGARTPVVSPMTEPMVDLSAFPGEERESRERLQLALGDGYEVRDLLGQGGFGLVFTAWDVRLKRDLAVKVLRTELARASGAFLERFEREAMTAAQLRHPNIVPIYSIGEKDGLAYIVMPLIRGETLQATLERDGPLPLGESCRILVDAAGALAAAHTVGLIHRDIKPDNIMLEGPERRVLLMDFGIAKMVRPGDASLTATGVLIGTPLYMSPEQGAGDRDVDQRSDIYSFGVVAYHMLTGKPPFAGTSGADLIRHHVLTPAEDVRVTRPNIPPALAHVVMRCLQKDRERRWHSAGDLRDALARAATQAPAGRARNSMFRLRRAATKRKVPVAAIALVLVLAALVPVFRTRAREAVPRPDSVPAAIQRDPLDSLLLASRGAAEYARQRALLSGATLAQLHPGDSVRQIADSMAAAGKKPEAAVLLTSAASLWEKAEQDLRPSQPRPGPRTGESRTTPAATTVSPAPSATPATAVSDSQAIVRYYAELASAIESRQLGEVKRLLPNLTPTEERNWRSLFDDRDIETLAAGFTILNLTRRDDMAYARVQYSQVVTKRGRPQERTRLTLATLSRGPQGWRVIREETSR